MKTQMTLITTLTLALSSFNALSAEVCTVSMMGRVCYEEGSEAAIAAHMKGDAVAQANSKRNLRTGNNQRSCLEEMAEDLRGRRLPW